jgi:hypothetical protein
VVKMDRGHTEKYCGRIFSKDELEQITEIVSSCRGLTRTELANTVCELFIWKRPTERLKTVECRQFLEHLESKGILSLPQRKNRQHCGTNTKTLKTEKGKFQPPITGKASQFFPLRLTRVNTKEQRDLWYESTAILY